MNQSYNQGTIGQSFISEGSVKKKIMLQSRETTRIILITFILMPYFQGIFCIGEGMCHSFHVM